MVTSLLSIGAVLTGRRSTYTIVKELHKALDDGAVYLARSKENERCIVKSIRGHWRLKNEADILKRYKTTFLRPLMDEIQDPADPPSIVLRYLESDMLAESNAKRLSRREIKLVARCILEALNVLHKDGMVHTDVKLDNVFVNYGHDDERFAEMQLGDLGGVVSQDSKFAKAGHHIGAVFTRSPEAMLQLPWDTATDIWSFGNAILSLVYGGSYHLFDPRHDEVALDHYDCELTVVRRMYKFFGPFPQAYENYNSVNSDIIQIVNVLNNEKPPEKPFVRITPREVPLADKQFILKITQLYPSDRTTAEELLADRWFREDSEDTREPLAGRAPEDAN